MCWGGHACCGTSWGAAVPAAGCTMMLLPWQSRGARVVFPVASGRDPAAAGDVVSLPVGHLIGCSRSTRVHLHVCALWGQLQLMPGWPVAVPVFGPGLACVLGHPDDGGHKPVLMVQHMVRWQQTGMVVGQTIHWSTQAAPGAAQGVHLTTGAALLWQVAARRHVCSGAGPFQGLAAGGCCSRVLQQPALKEHF
jgi:hypothetical protein